MDNTLPVNLKYCTFYFFCGVVEPPTFWVAPCQVCHVVKGSELKGCCITENAHLSTKLCFSSRNIYVLTIMLKLKISCDVGVTSPPQQLLPQQSSEEEPVALTISRGKEDVSTFFKVPHHLDPTNNNFQDLKRKTDFVLVYEEDKRDAVRGQLPTVN